MRKINSLGAGDVFLGSVAYSILKNHSEEKMLALASFVAVSKCKGTGTERIPHSKDVPTELL